MKHFRNVWISLHCCTYRILYFHTWYQRIVYVIRMENHLIILYKTCQRQPQLSIFSPPKPSDRTQERDRLLAKLETGMVQKIYFQFGSDLELLQSSLEWLASLPNHTTERRNTKSHFTTAIDSDDDPTTSTSTSPSLPQLDLELSPDPSLRQHWRIALHYNSVVTKKVTDG